MKPRNICEYCGHELTKRELAASKKLTAQIIGGLVTTIVAYIIAPVILKELNKALKKPKARQHRRK